MKVIFIHFIGHKVNCDSLSKFLNRYMNIIHVLTKCGLSASTQNINNSNMKQKLNLYQTGKKKA